MPHKNTGHTKQSKPTVVNGFLNLFKPSGITSMDALREIKRLAGRHHKIGHGGTLDPIASGVLPVCFGQATRLMDYIVDGVKVYRAEVTLGISTTTYDSQGETVRTAEFPRISLELVKESIKPWVGAVHQTPPMYSALKMEGKRLYKLARAGIEIDRKTRLVEIHEIEILEFYYPKLIIKIKCGKGTYIRSLAHDIGEALGCGGHVSDLVRLCCGGFSADDSLTLERLKEFGETPEIWKSHLYSLDRVLKDLKSITIGKQAEEKLRHGQAFSILQPELESNDMEQRRAYNCEGMFIALIQFDQPTNTWRPIKVFNTETPSPYAPTFI